MKRVTKVVKIKVNDRLSLFLLVVFLVLTFLLFYYQPRIHHNDLITPCGKIVGGMSPDKPPPDRVCRCNGKVEVIDKRYVDGDRLEYCLGKGWSILKR